MFTAGLRAGERAAAPVAIGLLAPTEETEAASLRQGATLGVEHANETPGPRARLVIRGRPGQWGTEGDEAAALASDDEVGAIIAPSAGVGSHQALQVAGRTRVPVVSLCADSSITGTGIPWLVRIAPRSDEEARILFTSLTNAAFGRRLRWSALVPSDRAGREAGRDLEAAAKAAGCLLQEPIRLPVNPVEWTPILKELLAVPPKVILLWTDPATAGYLARSLRDAGYKGLLAGPGRLASPVFLSTAGNSADGVTIPTVAPDPESERTASRFSETYQTRFGSAPDVTAKLAYDATRLLTDVLRKSTAQASYRAFPLKNTFTGASGLLKFDRDGNRVVRLVLQVCRNGQFNPRSELRPKSGSSLATLSVNQ